MFPRCLPYLFEVCCSYFVAPVPSRESPAKSFTVTIHTCLGIMLPVNAQTQTQSYVDSSETVAGCSSAPEQRILAAELLMS